MTDFNLENFDEVLKEKKITVVDFWAEWCGPCRMFAPIINELSETVKDLDVNVLKINVEENTDLARKFSIRNIPCLIMFKDGEEFHRKPGLSTVQEMLDIIKENL